MRKLALIVVLFLLCLVTSTVFAAPSYELSETSDQGKHYLDINSIYKDVKNPNIIYYTTKSEWYPQYRDANMGDYSLMLACINIQKQASKALEFQGYSSSGKLLFKSPFTDPWKIFGADDQFYRRIIQIANTNEQAGQTSQSVTPSQPATATGVVYNGPLRGKGWKMENPETGVNTDVKKIVISSITTGSFNYNGDAWIHIITDTSNRIDIDIESTFHGDVQYKEYYTHLLRLRYGNQEATYPLKTRYGTLNGDLTKVPGQIEITVDGNKVVVNLIVNGMIARHIEAIDEQTKSFSGIVSSFGAEGNMQIYK